MVSVPPEAVTAAWNEAPASGPASLDDVRAMLEAAAPAIAAAERETHERSVNALQIATIALARLALIDEMAGMGQRDGDPELRARCRRAQRALDEIAAVLREQP